MRNPFSGKMTLYLSSKDDRFAAKHIVKSMVKAGAEDGSFLSSTDIRGVAYVENRALDAARMPGNNLGQFKANAGVRWVHTRGSVDLCPSHSNMIC